MQQVPVHLLSVRSIGLRKAHGGPTCPRKRGEEGWAGGNFQGRRQPKAECPDCPVAYLSLLAPQDWRSHL